MSNVLCGSFFRAQSSAVWTVYSAGNFLLHVVLAFSRFPRSLPAPAGADAASGILIGAAVRPAQLSESAYAATLAREFNMVEPEDALKWEVLRPDPQTFDFSKPIKCSTSLCAMT